MPLYDNLRNQAKLDSRRFAKGTVCRIIYGDLLDIVYSEGVVPSGIYLNTKTGLDSINNKMLVMPVIVYPEISKLLLTYKNSIPTEEGEVETDNLEKITLASQGIVSVLKQNIVLVTVEINTPHGKLAGLSPETYDIMIDSIDVNQTIEGRYVYRTVADLRKQESFNKD